MTLDYTTKGEIKIDMQNDAKNMIDEFQKNIKKSGSNNTGNPRSI